MFGPHQLRPYGRSRKLAFEHNYVWFGSVCVNELAYGRELSNDIGEFKEESYCVMLPVAGDYAISVDGKSVAGGVESVTIINPHRPVTLEASTDYRNISVRLSRRAIDEAIRNRAGQAPTEKVCFSAYPQPIAAETKPLRDLVMQLWSSAAQDSACATFGAMGGELECLLASMVLMSVPNNYSEHLAPRRPVKESSAAAKAVQFLRRHARETISVSQMLAASGVQKTALYAEFHKQYGVTPMVFLRNERLQLARQTLLAAQAGSISVTRVASDCGFQHFSRFAEYYRQRFGELPSATLAGSLDSL